MVVLLLKSGLDFKFNKHKDNEANIQDCTDFSIKYNIKLEDIQSRREVDDDAVPVFTIANQA